jgi:hypothetical protein
MHWEPTDRDDFFQQKWIEQVFPLFLPEKEFHTGITDGVQGRLFQSGYQTATEDQQELLNTFLRALF